MGMAEAYDADYQHYIGVKHIQARPMSHKEHRLGKGMGWQGDIPNEPGYEVMYPDGYKSWSPKQVFENAYFPMGEGADPTKVNEDMVDRFIVDHESVKLGNKTTVCRVVLANDFEITASSACVDEKNYDHALGQKIAFGRAKDQVWKLLGFLLQSARFGIKR